MFVSPRIVTATAFAVGFFAMLSAPVSAENGVSADTVVFGQAAPLDHIASDFEGEPTHRRRAARPRQAGGTHKAAPHRLQPAGARHRGGNPRCTHTVVQRRPTGGCEPSVAAPQPIRDAHLWGPLPQVPPRWRAMKPP